jgi:hypothetical protein
LSGMTMGATATAGGPVTVSTSQDPLPSASTPSGYVVEGDVVVLIVIVSFLIVIILYCFCCGVQHCRLLLNVSDCWRRIRRVQDGRADASDRLLQRDRLLHIERDAQQNA